jgi:periplasmic divalent cation tolerance protein
MSPTLCLAYITTSNENEATSIGKALVERRLAACVNIIPGMTSLYWWKGKMETGHETILIAKTRKTLFKKLVTAVKSLHSYSVPCVIELDIIAGNRDYLAWMMEETRRQPGK